MYKSIIISLGIFLVSASSAQALEKNSAGQALMAVLDAQPDEAKARYQYRRPYNTLRFFGIKPGMKVAEALPGGGWYSKILLPYLGSEGSLLGLDYNIEMWPNFGFATEEWIEKRKSWSTSWPADAQPWRGENGASVSAATFGTVPKDALGTYDAVLLIRALHNLARHEKKGGYLSSALSDSFALLKPGGVVGIVQHEARADRSDAWADGSNGYLKKSFVIEVMQKAGFTLIDDSDLNANPKDQAKEGDIVWRLPPSYADSKDDAARKMEMSEIGESNRMTLLFRKPLPSM